jgi:hypothetical protein
LSPQGALAQLVARFVRNEKVRGSNPLSSTTLEDSNGIGLRADAVFVFPVVAQVVNSSKALAKSTASIVVISSEVGVPLSP